MLKRFENWLFYIFLFAIPISLRHIFGYQPFGYVEWTAKYVYLTDILFFTLLVFWVWQAMLLAPVAEGDPRGAVQAKFLGRALAAQESPRKPTGLVSRVWGKGHRLPDLILILFVVISGISIKNAIDVPTAVFQWAKLLEGVALYFYVKDYAFKRFDLGKGFTALVFGGVLQSVIAIVQFTTQGSLGLKWLGESVLMPALSGIAAFYVNGIKVMRAYGTTPHSNVLALYLFIAIGAFYFGSIYTKKSRWAYAAYAVLLWALFTTFSRTVIFFWAFGFASRALLIAFNKEFRKDFWENLEVRKRVLAILGITVTVVVVFAVLYWPYVASRSVISTGDEAVQLRVLYNQESLKSGYNWFGLGMGNFVPWLRQQNLHLNPILYQPVHNIYLLIYSETGILGFMAFLVFLGLLWVQYYQRLKFRWLRHFSFALIIGSVLAFGLFDHFLWTIQAGRLILWLALGLLAGAE